MKQTNHVLQSIMRSLKIDFKLVIDQINNEFHKFFSNKQLEEFAILEEAMKQVLEDPKNDLNMNLIPYTDQDIKFIHKNLKIIDSKKHQDVSFEIDKVMHTIQKLNTRLKQAEEHLNKQAKKLEENKKPKNSFYKQIFESKEKSSIERSA
ncbi:MAG: hypothetical protein HRT47_07290 [Candidatus Caenarcaniphilales bacterium]|nr:hypothetical protein [Candidatus Caenarcaniphilales bacterium]